MLSHLITRQQITQHAIVPNKKALNKTEEIGCRGNKTTNHAYGNDVTVNGYPRRNSKTKRKLTFALACLSSPIMVAIMLDLVELGENPSQGGTKISLVHWTGTRFRLSFSHHPDPSDHHLIINPCSEKASKPYNFNVMSQILNRNIP